MSTQKLPIEQRLRAALALVVDDEGHNAESARFMAARSMTQADPEERFRCQRVALWHAVFACSNAWEAGDVLDEYERC